jgi:carboxylesterase
VQSFAQAEFRISEARAGESGVLRPECETLFLSHGRKTARAIVLVHGYTSCPAQFAMLGRQLFDDGSNVLIVPLPYHGLPDRMNEVHAKLTALQLVDYADDVVDIAQGLGEKVVIAGLSVGGLVATWAAQHRADVDLAVPISPVLGYAVVPPVWSQAAANITRLLPNRFEWWDTVAAEKMTPEYAYPKYSRRTLAQALTLATAVIRSARRHPPSAQRLVMVGNKNDLLISNTRIDEIVGSWQNTAPQKISTFYFPASLGAAHDLIDVTRHDQKTDVVYPRLRQLLLR